MSKRKPPTPTDFILTDFLLCEERRRREEERRNREINEQLDYFRRNLFIWRLDPPRRVR